ncbi:MAG: D-tyrosyl-tRNA(Tyr) deacylase [Anaerolineales bacterium]|nr:D-tyrosyl-tRNA(Tyr) deacylase [Anaerolineales bacterium]
MRVLIQRVTHGRVTVGGETVGEIGRGFVALVGVTHADTAVQAHWLADKVAGLRVFEDADGKMNLALPDVGGGVLAISQFTLYGDARKGKRPSFTAAAPPATAEPLVDAFCRQLRTHGIPVASGIFGAHMAVTIHNDGPVTLLLEKDP